MRRRVIVVFVSMLFVAFPVLGSLASAAPVAAQPVSCSSFDSWVWSQTVYESDENQYATLDPDGDGLSCPNLPITGVAPVSWTKSIPSDAVPAQVTSIVDGDDLYVSRNGTAEPIHLVGMNAPEPHSSTEPVECGGAGATVALQQIVALVPNQTVYLEYDQTERDRHDRHLAYVWFQRGDQVYLVNEALVRTGWAESTTLSRPNAKYGKRIDAAERFSVEHVLGTRLACGGFDRPLGSQPSPAQIRQAMAMQPDQGQFAAYVGAP